MRSPIKQIRLQTIAMVVITAPLLWMLGAWALAPLTVAVPAALETADPGARPPAPLQVLAIDPRVFDVALWHEPVVIAKEAANPEPRRPARPPRVPLQLLAISTDGAEYTANLYDEEADAIVLVQTGGTVAGCDVINVTAHSVTLRRRDQTVTLALDLGAMP